MKTKLRRISKRSLAMLLSVLMMVSVLGLGSLITAEAWTTNSLSFTGTVNSSKKGYSSTWNTISMDGNSSDYYYTTFVIEKSKTVSFKFIDQWNQYLGGGTSGSGTNCKYYYGMSTSGGNDSFTTGSTYDYYICAVQCWTNYDGEWRCRIDMFGCNKATVHYYNASTHKRLYAYETGYGNSNSKGSSVGTNNDTGTAYLNGSWNNEGDDSTSAHSVLSGYSKNWYTHSTPYSTVSSKNTTFKLIPHSASAQMKEATITISDLESNNKEVWVYNSSTTADPVVTYRAALRDEFSSATRDYATAYNSGTNPGFTSATYTAFKNAYEDAADKYAAYASTQSQINTALSTMRSTYDALAVDVTWVGATGTIYTDTCTIGNTPSYDSTTYGTPTKASTAQYSYTFTDWSPSPAAVTASGGAQTMTAQFSSTTRSYTIKKTESGTSGGTVTIGSTTVTTSNKSVNYGTYTITVAAPSGYNVQSVSGVPGTWSGLNTGTATLSSYTHSSNVTLTITYVSSTVPGITVTTNKASGNIGETFAITATKTNPTGSAGGITYSVTKDSSAATVNTDYTVTTSGTNPMTINIVPLKSGSFTVTARYTDTGDPSNSASFTVNSPSVSAFSYSTSNCNIGATSVSPSVTTTNPSNSSSLPSGWSIVYSITSGSSYATINSSTGVITGTAGSGSGGVTVKASLQYNSSEKASKTTTFTVNTPTITVGNKTGLKIGESYTPSPSLTNPSSTSSAWTVTYEKTTNNNATTISGSTITGDTYNATGDTYTAYFKYNNETKASTTFTVKTADPTITFNSTAQTINVGGTVTKTATGGNIGSGATSTITYESADTTIATVSSAGVVTGVKPGTTTITAKNTVKISSTVKAEKTASYSVTVSEPTVSITSGNKVAVGDTLSLTATSSGATTTPTYTWSRTNGTGAATVSGSTLTGTSAGTVTVKVSAKYNNNYTKEVTKTVTVEAPSLTVKDGSTSVANSTLYTTIGTNKTLTVGKNFSDAATAVSSKTSVATVSLSGTTLTITPVAKGTTTVTVSAGSAASLNSISPTHNLSSSAINKRIRLAVAPQTVSFTVNVAAADNNKFITYATSSWTGTVYAWYNDTWHTMTKVGTDDGSKAVWAFNVGSSYPSTVVFSSQNSWDSGGNGLKQTVDCSVTATANSFYENGTSNGKRNVGSYTTTITIPQLSVDPMTVQVGETKNLTTTVVNNTTPAKTTYTSADTSKFTVNNSGAVTGVDTTSGTNVTVRAWAAKPHDNWATWITDSTTQALLSGTATAAITVTADPKNITYRRKYSDNGTTWNNASNTQGTFTVTSGGSSIGAEGSAHSIAYNSTLTLTATPASGYAVEGIYWSVDSGSTWTKVECAVSNGVYTNNSFKANNDYLLEARFVKVYKLSPFNSYEKKNDTVYFITSPPKQIKVKHTDAHGTATTYTYSYDGTKAQGNPDSPDVVNASGTLPIASGTYGQGNYIQYYAGDEITLTYSAMATSEILKGVFYNNNANYYVNKPTSAQFVAHSHPSSTAIYMNSAYYTNAELGGRDFSGVASDNDVHSIKFTGTSDYKNIDVEVGTKRKVYFSDYDNTVINSKNMDDYYFDGEALSVTGDQLTVKAKQSAVQTNSITATSVRYYKANADGSKGTELTAEEKTALGLSITGSTSTSTSSGDGAALVFNGNMPAYDLYIDLNMANSYTIKLGTKIVSDLGGSNTRLRQAATAISIAGSTTLNANTSDYVTSGSTSVSVGSSATLTVSGITSGYMFVGWYWGDDSAPDYDKGFISDKLALSYAPRKGGTIWAVGTKDLFINGSKYITGKDTNWYAESGTQKNLEMSFDAETGRYYWEITDTMFAAAGNEYKTWEENNNNTTYGTYHKGGDNYYYWYDNDDKYHGKSFFQLFDTESGNNNKSIWNQLTSFKVDTPANGPTYGKIYPSADDYGTKTWNGQGFINFYESSYQGYSSPLRIYYDPNASGTAKLTVEATPIYSDIYVSNGFDVGSTLKSDAVTVQPVVDGVVKTSGQTGFFSVGAGTTYSPDHEGTVTKYTPAKKGATVRITKKAGGSDKIAAFLIYDIDNKTVRAEKNITKGTTSSGKTPYYIDLTLENVKQSLYIVPIVEEAVPNDAKQVTITFDATQLNRKQWGDIVTAYAWYKTSNAPGLGAYPGQPMIPSDDMSTWTTSFVSIKSGNELAGITFSNYVDGNHSWLGCTGVMGTVSDAQQKSGEATGGIVNVYNHVSSGNEGEYSRTNYKAQTYDYHEPIALYDRYKNEDSVNITFQMKDGNSSLISWRHHEFDNHNILNLPSDWGKLNWEYLTNAKGDQYVDMNGSPLGANNKPTATFYVAAKGQVVYNNSTMDYVFHGGHDYEMKGYTATYSDPGSGQDRGSYAKSALASGEWSSNITYGGTDGLDMKYGVQWYVYDAQGNYITTVLSAGIADLSSNNVDTYIAKELEDKGYAVDGKSVAICYDKPRYMYGDWTSVTNSANNINCGPNFDAYRFTGQWIAAAQTDTVKVNVEVAMMTDSGEVLAHSNTAGYGSATASKVAGVTFGKPGYATAASDGSWAQTAATDAKLNGIQLDASEQNFIGWYYYDANTDEFTKANYKSHDGFRPNYTNKDVTYYAVYRASAIYQFNYTGREGARTYSAAGNDLTEAELSNSSKINEASHETDIKNKVPVGIGIFKKTISFAPASYSTWTKTPDDAGYILNITGFATTSPTYTLTAHYKDASGADRTMTKSAVYNSNDSVVNLTALNEGTAVTTQYGTTDHKFLGWYEYKNGVVGDLLSTQANFGMRITRDQAIIAKYDEDGSTTNPDDGWNAFIDENVVNKELTTSSSGVFYNDTIVRVRNGSDVKAELPTGSKFGVLVINENNLTPTKAIDSYSESDLNSLVGRIASGQTMQAKSGIYITNMQSTTQTSFNRTDIAVRSDYAKSNGCRYCVYAYFYDGKGKAYHFSAASDIKTYE